MTTLIISNDVREQNGGFFSALLGALGASLLGDLLIGNIKGKGVLRASEGVLRAGHGRPSSFALQNNNKMDFQYCLIL